MKKFAFIPMAAVVAFAACEQDTSLMAPDELNIGVSSPGTAVDATAEIAGPEQTITTYLSGGLTATSGHRNRTCSGNGVYSWTTGPERSPTNHVSDENHATCTTTSIRPGSAIEISFAMTANYVQPPSGNIHLNFSMCGYTEVEVEPDVFEWVPSPCTAPTYIHYKHDKKTNTGEIAATGILSGRDDNGDVWTIDLAQLNGVPGVDGLAPNVRSFSLLAFGPDGADAAADLSW